MVKTSTPHNPVTFIGIGGYGFSGYAGLNIVWFTSVYLFLLKTGQRSLETINRLFGTKSPLVRDMERWVTSYAQTNMSEGKEQCADADK